MINKNFEDNEENSKMGSKKERYYKSKTITASWVTVPMGSSSLATLTSASPNNFPSCTFRLPDR